MDVELLLHNRVEQLHQGANELTIISGVFVLTAKSVITNQKSKME
jgi:hypothetical protein